MENNSVIYIRVSDQSQIDNNSLETQEKICRSFAGSKGFAVTKVYRDEGKSAKHVFTRPALKELLSYCTNKKNSVNVVIVYRFDRFSRNTYEGLTAMSLLAKHGVEVVSATEVSDMNPMGKAIRTVLMAFGQLDNEMKGERVKDNMQEVFRKGFWPFKSPIGYKRPFRTKEENKGKVTILDTKLAPIVKNMFNNAAKGVYNKSQLARLMNLEGFAEFYGKEATHKVVHEILSKTFYFGYMYAKKWDEYSWGKHEYLIDQQTWEKAYQAVMREKSPYKFQDSSQYPLKGYLKCELCDKPMTTCPSKGRNRIFHYYECRNKECRQIRIGSDVAHQKFREVLHTIKPSETSLALFEDMVFSEWDRVIEEAKRQSLKLGERITKLQAELTSIRTAKDEGVYTIDEARSQADSIRQDIAVLSVEKADIKYEEYDTTLVRDFTHNFLSNFDKLWDRLDLPKQQVFLEKAFPQGMLCTQTKEIRTVELSPSFQLIKTLSEQKGENVTL